MKESGKPRLIKLKFVVEMLNEIPYFVPYQNLLELFIHRLSRIHYWLTECLKFPATNSDSQFYSFSTMQCPLHLTTENTPFS